MSSGRRRPALLRQARQALAEGGLLLLEAHTLAAVARVGAAGTSWYAATEGLFSPQPHLVLEENFWEVATKAATTRYWVVDASSGLATRYAMTTQGYSEDEYEAVLEESGFAEVRSFPSLTGREDPVHGDLFVLTARAMGELGAE